MRGDECDLGTPEEDISSLLAVDALDVPQKMLACLGFGVDAFHGICHALFLENTAALIRSQAFLGSFSLTAEMEAVRAYREATLEFGACPVSERQFEPPVSRPGLTQYPRHRQRDQPVRQA